MYIRIVHMCVFAHARICTYVYVYKYVLMHVYIYVSGCIVFDGVALDERKIIQTQRYKY